MARAGPAKRRSISQGPKMMEEEIFAGMADLLEKIYA